MNTYAKPYRKQDGWFKFWVYEYDPSCFATLILHRSPEEFETIEEAKKATDAYVEKNNLTITR